jgi:5-methylcytosine-specific restriction endonuclease McrA
LSSPHLKHKVCPDCGVDKLREEYYVRKNGHIMLRCKPCTKVYNRKLYIERRDKNLAYAAKYRKENPDTTKEIQRKWRSENGKRRKELEHRRRTRKQENGVYVISPKDMRLLERPCAYCGSNGSITMDHIVPISRGGTHGIGNLVPCCNRCNTIKNARTIMEWRMEKPRPPRG